MANTLYTLDATSGTLLYSGLTDALVDKYGSDNVTVHYNNGTYFIFSCPAIFDGVIKLYNLDKIYYGSSWSSTSSINDQVEVTSYTGFFTSTTKMVLGDSFLFVATSTSNSASQYALLVGKTTSGNSIICTGANSSSLASYMRCKCINTGGTVRILTPSGNFYCDETTPYIMPLYYSDNNIAAVTSDGSFDTIQGISVAAYKGGLIERDNALFSCGTLFANSESSAFGSIMAQF